PKALTEVKIADENKANQKEILIEDNCTVTIAQFQPKAKELRTILMILKMNNDLERMGDHAVNISKNSLVLLEQPKINSLTHIPEMGKKALNMLKDSITSFINEDALLAKAVCERDDEVDNYRKIILSELLKHMHDDPQKIDRAIRLINISKDIERIADLATNICEDVLYMVAGRVIKHHHEENLQKK
ncbi:MAG: phosphate signaling complex protein PhoU, partial [Candidatus Margulisbacteria bacterium]|nr:phosphate signaling complex protein PhoU [Candidatus Margulisiibacteriota bacterium]